MNCGACGNPEVLPWEYEHVKTGKKIHLCNTCSKIALRNNFMKTENKNDTMFQEIKDDLNDRLRGQPNSLAATSDEVRISWLICEVQELRSQVEQMKKIIQENKKEV